jgi:hypothetical protein
MKTNSEIAHIWANQLEYRGQQSNLFFERSVIYSYGYHFPIAKHIDYKTVLITMRGYSNSTAKHIRFVENAISHKDLIYCNDPTKSHEHNISEFIIDIKKVAANLVNARKPQNYLTVIDYIKNNLNKYLTYFDIKLNKNQLEKIQITSKNDYLELIEKEKQAQIKKDKKEIAIGKKLYPLYVHNFRNNLKNDFTHLEQKAIEKHYNLIGAPILFKVTSSGIQSSKGINLTIEVAKRYINKFLSHEIKVTDKILNYSVDQINKDFIKIGCHNIYRNEIEYLNTILN